MRAGSERAVILAGRLTQANDAVIAFVDQCPVEDWRAVTQEEGWPVGVVCHHIAWIFGAHRALVERAAAGEPLPAEITWELVHERNAQQAREWADYAPETTRDLLRQQGDEAAQTVRQLSDAQLARTTVFSLVGETPITTEVLVKIMTNHALGHLKSAQTTASDSSQ